MFRIFPILPQSEASMYHFELMSTWFPRVVCCTTFCLNHQHPWSVFGLQCCKRYVRRVSALNERMQFDLWSIWQLILIELLHHCWWLTDFTSPYFELSTVVGVVQVVRKGGPHQIYLGQPGTVNSWQQLAKKRNVFVSLWSLIINKIILDIIWIISNNKITVSEQDWKDC